MAARVFSIDREEIRRTTAVIPRTPSRGRKRGGWSPEWFQGFFDTYVLIANANPEPVTATITFLRENDTPVVQTVPVGAFARETIYAGEYSDVVGRAFGIVVEATRPVIAERAMYFASLPGRLWSGGHANTGIGRRRRPGSTRRARPARSSTRSSC